MAEPINTGLSTQEPLNTGLSAQQVLTAFYRALNDYTDAEIDALLSEKQGTIADLSEIRSGAAAGATAVQQSVFETDQARQETEIGAVANAGAKNLLKITESSQTIKGVTFTVNADQTVTVNGTNDGTGASAFIMVPNAQAITIPDGKYILSGCPASGGGDVASATFDLRWYMYSPGKSAYDSGNGASIEKSGNTTSSNIAIVVKTGQTANNLVFKPMLRPVEITDDTFVPYAKTNRELTVAGDEDRAALVEQVDEGAKNLLRITASSQVVGGVTFTVNADGTIIANGTKTNNDWFYLSTGNSLDAGTYVLSSGLASQSDMNLRLLITTADSLGSAIMSAEGTRQAHIRQLTSDYTGLYYAIRISSGTTVNNVVFKPMLCTAVCYAISPAFVPYAPTNRELYEICETKVTMQQVYGDATEIPANSDLNDYTTPGIYYALVANTSTIANTPYTATGFRVVVEKNTISGTAVFQTIYPTSRSHLEFYRRVYEGGSWSSWYKFEGTVVS